MSLDLHARVLVLCDGMVLGADGYEGGPLLLVHWDPDPAVVQRREAEALGERCPRSGVVRRSRSAK